MCERRDLLLYHKELHYMKMSVLGEPTKQKKSSLMNTVFGVGANPYFCATLYPIKTCG
jgi:hypothetical protein